MKKYNLLHLAKNTLLFTALYAGLQSCESPKEVSAVYFNTVTAEQSGVDFENTLTPSADLNIIEYLYFYNGAGVAIGDLNNDGLEDLFITGNQVQDRVYENLGGLKFKDQTAAADINTQNSWSNGVTLADVNNDGLLDVYVSVVGNYKTLKGHNKLFLNQGNFKFTEIAQEVNIAFSGFGTQASFFDYDNDGDLDLYLLNHTVHTPRSYGKAEKRTEKDPLSGDLLFENTLETGVLNFIDVTQAAGIYNSPLGYGLGLATADLNKDGFIDIYVGNDFHENDYIYLNNGDKTFREASAEMTSNSSRFTMGLDAADLNNDALIDVFTLDMMPDQASIRLKSGGEDSDKVAQIKEGFGFQTQYSRNHFQLNNGQGAFQEIALLTETYATDWSWSALIEDFDNDGLSDIFISNGIYRRPNDLDYINYLSNLNFSQYNQDQQDLLEKKLIEEMPQLEIANVLLHNQGGFKFKKHSSAAGLKNNYSNGAAYADLDLDGDMDLVVNNINSPLEILENTQDPSRHNFVGVKLVPSAEIKNTSGAKLTLFSGQQVWYKELTATRGYASASSQNIHFGIGKNTTIDSLTITFPIGGTQTIKDVSINTYQEISALKNAKIAQSKTDKKNTTAVVNFPFTHQENKYYDYEREPLMLEKLSTEGPCYVHEDFNGDGLKDLFIGGAKYQESAFYTQNEAGTFTAEIKTVISEDALYEDVDAAAIDFDNDGDLDLYVMSGGNDSPEGDIQLADRLYVNDGEGNFTRSKANLPMANGGSISVADFDNDGFSDLFLGFRSVPGAYGISPSSVILRNTQKGNFELLERKDYGMITDSAWGDMNQDGLLDLVLVGDFMPITVLINKDGRNFENQTEALGLANTQGLWNTVLLQDLNGDNKPEIIAGNAGLNMKIQASVDDPVEIYLEDFDKNEQLDPTVFHTYEGEHIPFASKDMLSKQMPMLKKKFTSYTSFSKVREIGQLYDNPTDEIETKYLKELRSMVYVNNGIFQGEPLPIEAQMSSIEDFYVDHQSGDLKLYYVGNYKGFVTELGNSPANTGGILSGFNGNTFTKNNTLPLPPFMEARAIGPLNNNKLLVLFNNDTTKTIDLNLK